MNELGANHLTSETHDADTYNGCSALRGRARQRDLSTFGKSPSPRVKKEVEEER